MKLSREDVEKIAHLARLRLGVKEVEKFSGQLSNILTYINKLNELDTNDIEPTAHAVAIGTPFRSDEVKKSGIKEAALANAPARDGEFFKVPKVI